MPRDVRMALVQPIDAGDWIIVVAFLLMSGVLVFLSFLSDVSVAIGTVAIYGFFSGRIYERVRNARMSVTVAVKGGADA